MNETRKIDDRMAQAYKLIDRSEFGSKSRWRYTVMALLRPDGGPHQDEVLALFSSRANAAGFSSQCAAHGEAWAYHKHAAQMAPNSPIHRRAVAAS